ncbi:response regulator [Brevibacillus marinus]|jgi:two-component system CitB family response regulator|uniref:response regulator n=1 Tax=Brevibacillus marinus TaxID=2496837 RepID=UPI000F81E414|nr:response regulator [Brevibacillus marinus]
MSQQPLTVMIVEDDEIAAKIYEQFTAKSENYRVVATAKTGKQAKELLHVFTPDLILLDVYLPDMSGIDLMWEIRKQHLEIDVILITAANDTETVSEAIRGGAFSYIIKPISVEKLLAVLEQFAQTRQQLSGQRALEQHEVDHLFHSGEMPRAAAGSSGAVQLPKGIDKHTLRFVREKLADETGSFNADEMAERVGTSHSTIRRYLEYLVANGELEVEMVYGSIGRPERRYRRK